MNIFRYFFIYVFLKTNIVHLFIFMMILTIKLDCDKTHPEKLFSMPNPMQHKKYGLSQTPISNMGVPVVIEIIL
ncbi:MAG TPA: hypothetical protein DD633_01490 [Sphaerochaeta sp.]|jgi:hypothetical protein|nr:hypothetical protein [Sphaerochaeta sp.]